MVAAETPEQRHRVRRIEAELDDLEQRFGVDDHDAIAGAYLRRGIRGITIATSDGGELSERERLVLIRYAIGHRLVAIARELGLSGRTIETYLTRAQEKLRIHGRAEVIRFAIGRGWIT